MQRYAHEAAVHLASRGAEVTVFCEPPRAATGEGAERRAARSGAFSVRFVASPRLPILGRWPGTVILDRITNYFAFSERAARQVLASGGERPFDVVYAQGLGGWGVARRAAASGWDGPALVSNNHGMEEFKNTDPRKHLLYAPFRAGIRRTARAAAAVVVTDLAARDESRRLLGFSARTWAVVPTPIDLAGIERLRDDALRARWRERLTVRDGAPLIVSVARLERNKGLDVAIDAFATVRDRLPSGWRWAIVGQGSQQDRLSVAVAAHGLAGAVQLVGGVGDAELHGLYAAADLFVHPTLFEGTSIVTQEAMAHALPIVASAAGGIPEKITHGVSGLLVPPGNRQALALAIVSVLTLPDRGRALGRAAREVVAARFDWPKVAAELLAALARARESASRTLDN